MNLLVVTQKVDKDDENLGAFYYWFCYMAQHVEHLTIIADKAGNFHFPPNVEVLSLGKERGKHKLYRFAKYWEHFSRCYAEADAVFFHQIPEFVVAASPFLLSLKRTTSLWYAHGGIPTRRLKIAERLVDFIFTSSASGFRLPSKKALAVGQAIHTNLFRPSEEARKKNERRGVNLICVGRIAPVKEQDVLIRACAILKETWDMPWSLSVVGGPMLDRDKSYYKLLKSLVVEYGLSGYVNFQGVQKYEDIPQILNDHDIFVNLSKTGSLDKVVLEAMSCGLSVATSNEAYRSLLDERYFISRASPEFIAEKIKKLAEEARPNIALREIVVRDHGMERTVDRILAVLKTPGAPHTF